MVKALCVLHNYLMTKQHADDDDGYCSAGYADSLSGIGERRNGSWRQELVQLPLQLERTKARNFAQMARYVRDMFRQYFCSAAGSVAWQQNVLQAWEKKSCFVRLFCFVFLLSITFLINCMFAEQCKLVSVARWCFFFPIYYFSQHLHVAEQFL